MRITLLISILFFFTRACIFDIDCDDSRVWTIDTCVEGDCFNAPTAGKCLNDFDCNDGHVCTTDTCNLNDCVYTPSGCCESDCDCEDYNECTADRCDLLSCVNEPIPDCCNDDDDCPGEVPCTLQQCNTQSHRCVIGIDNPACCQRDDDCFVGDVCEDVYRICVDGACQHAYDMGPPYCTMHQQCDDSNPSTCDACDYRYARSGPCGKCVNIGVIGEGFGPCCTTDQDCPPSKQCLLQYAQCVPSAWTECSENIDCDDGNGCIENVCAVIGPTSVVCLDIPLEYCPESCTIDTDCDDHDACTLNICESGDCLNPPIVPCQCRGDEDCGDEYGGTIDLCVYGECVFDPITPCWCAFDCPQPSECEIVQCLERTCNYEPNSACCTNTTNCYPLPPSCTLTYCDPTTNRCVYIGCTTGCSPMWWYTPICVVGCIMFILTFIAYWKVSSGLSKNKYK